ncbi:MAG TPA: vitamin K epoxide reductase family protein [Candidatus Acidoferrales bacterium]|nr:vitamin K epoxide reductase family protein [Candidatus Acidoferrales bacterium]
MKARISALKLLLLVAMSIFGLWASSMVLVVYYTLKLQALPFCPLQKGPGIALDCYAVLSSSYSEFFGIPLELLAVGYFIVNLLLVYFIAFGGVRLAKASLRTLFGWRFIGIAIVPYLVFVELYLVRAICLYCTLMHIAIVADFVVISYLLFYKKFDVMK